jgi:hypothetical protein
MRLGRGLVAKIVVGVVAVGLLGFGVYSVVRDRMAKEYLRAEAVAKEAYDGSGIKADITSVKVAFAVRKEGVYAASSGDSFIGLSVDKWDRSYVSNYTSSNTDKDGNTSYHSHSRLVKQIRYLYSNSISLHQNLESALDKEAEFAVTNSKGKRFSVRVNAQYSYSRNGYRITAKASNGRDLGVSEVTVRFSGLVPDKSYAMAGVPFIAGKDGTAEVTFKTIGRGFENPDTFGRVTKYSLMSIDSEKNAKTEMTFIIPEAHIKGFIWNFPRI